MTVRRGHSLLLVECRGSNANVAFFTPQLTLPCDNQPLSARQANDSTLVDRRLRPCPGHVTYTLQTPYTPLNALITLLYPPVAVWKVDVTSVS